MGTRAPSRTAAAVVAIGVAMAIVIGACQPVETETTLPPGTTIPPAGDEDALLAVPVLSGFEVATNLEFAPDGRVFVAEKSGIIKTFDSIDDPTPSIAADLTAPVRSTGDHGLLGLAVDPQYPARPYLYVLHTTDSTGLWGDGCGSGYGINGCVTGAKISRVELDENAQMVGQPTTLVDDRWCFQFSSHGVGDLGFLPDGSLVASAGEGSLWEGADYGQHGGQQLFPPVPILTPRNPCDDPPNGAGGAVDPVTSEGGAFRAQDLLTSGDPLNWNGAMVRIDPDTGQAPADNPLAGGDPADDAVLAHGLRNPFRFAVRPGTDEVYTIDVGYVRFEEIDRIVALDDVVENFGWPCHEGPEVQATFAALNNQMCPRITAPGAPSTLTDPWYAYPHLGGSAISGIAFVPEGRYPGLEGDLMFTDYVKGLTWAVDVAPDGSRRGTAVTVSSDDITVDLEAAPDGYVYALNFSDGTVDRLVDRSAAPIARLEASPIDGPLPLTVTLDASSSEDPDGATLSFAWDLDGDGEFDDATSPTTTLTATEAVNRDVSVRVTNSDGASSTATTTLYPGNTPPTVTIDVTSPLPWTANGDVTFSLQGSDAEDGVLPVENVSWSAEIHHCYTPDDCHVHPYTSAAGSLGATISGPSHGNPSYLQLVATATDSRGQRTTVRRDLQPATVELLVTSTPPGATISIGQEQHVTPFTFTAVRDDSLSLSVPTPQTIGGDDYQFSAWDHGGGQSHQYSATADATLHVTLVPSGG